MTLKENNAADMRQMVDQLNRWAHEYYVLDAPSVPDTVYDALYDRLALLEKQTGVTLPDSPTHRVGGQPLKSFSQHRHLKRLYSLDKVQSFGQLREWLQKVNAAVGEVLFTVELKYDGLTINVTYDDGNFVGAATRGNGVVGEDVTQQVKTIRTVPLSIPFEGKCELQGEGIMKLSELDRYNHKHPSDRLKNARNAAAGAIRNLDPKVTAERNLDVVFYSSGYEEGLDVSSQRELIEFLRHNGMVSQPRFPHGKNLRGNKGGNRRNRRHAFLAGLSDRRRGDKGGRLCHSRTAGLHRQIPQVGGGVQV